MDIYTQPGKSVKFVGGGNNDTLTNDVLQVGLEYVVEAINVQPWVSYVTLENVEGRFNSVMFDNV